MVFSAKEKFRKTPKCDEMPQKCDQLNLTALAGEILETTIEGRIIAAKQTRIVTMFSIKNVNQLKLIGTEFR
jgi:hypothetical protein